MNVKKQLIQDNQVFQLGFYMTLFGTALALLWIGIFKFTNVEAAAIRPLIENHPLSFWIYDVFSEQGVSCLVGIIEIVLAILLLLSLKVKALRLYAGIGLIVVFSTTLSFLVFTPGVWNIVEGVVVTDFFILKDIVFLGAGFMLLGNRK